MKLPKIKHAVVTVLLIINTEILAVGMEVGMTCAASAEALESQAENTQSLPGTRQSESSLAVPKYSVGNCRLRAGEGVGALHVPETAQGVNGDAIPGKVVWSVVPTFEFILDEEMPLSGSEGEVIELFWRFVPDPVVAGYQSVSGTAKVTFAAAEENVYDRLAEQVLAQNRGETGGFCRGSSAAGSMASEDTLILVGDLYGLNHEFEKESVLVKESRAVGSPKTVRPESSVVPEVRKELRGNVWNGNPEEPDGSGGGSVNDGVEVNDVAVENLDENNMRWIVYREGKLLQSLRQAAAIFCAVFAAVLF